MRPTSIPVFGGGGDADGEIHPEVPDFTSSGKCTFLFCAVRLITIEVTILLYVVLYILCIFRINFCIFTYGGGGWSRNNRIHIGYIHGKASTR